MDLTPRDREFIKDLAWKIAFAHGRRAMRVPPARAELAKDIAEAITVCVETKLKVPRRAGPFE